MLIPKPEDSVKLKNRGEMSRKDIIIATLILAFLTMSVGLSGQGKSGIPTADTVAQSSVAFPCSAGTAVPIRGSVLSIEPTASGEFKLAKRIPWNGSGFDSSLGNLNDETAYVFLLTRWNASYGVPPSAVYTLLSSTWYVYRRDGANLVQSYAKNPTNGVLLPYGYHSAVIVGVQIVQYGPPPPAPPAPAPLSSVITYTVSTAIGTKQNISNLGAILGALAGVPAPKGPAALAYVAPSVQACVQAFAVPGTPPLPFNLSVTSTLTPGTVPKSAKDAGTSGVLNCTAATDQQPCAIARTFTAVDKEWWDVSIGLNAFGTRQPKFDATGKNPTTARNVDPYAFVTLFPTYWTLPKDAPIPVENLRWITVPHIDVGIPVKKQPLHRPFFGVAERIARTDKIFGIPVYFTGGVVRLIEDVPNGRGGLRQHTVWKSMFGFEFSGNTLVGKLTGK